ncbi:serine-type endopeptidase inhibitor activity [Sparganum proliferum]
MAEEFPIEKPTAALRQCFLPKEVGPCRRNVERFYFDSKSRTCKSFLFGGCHGNGNNFLSIAQCRAFCLP